MSKEFGRTLREVSPMPTFEESEAVKAVRSVERDIAVANLRPGDPLRTLGVSVCAAIRVALDLSVSIDGKLRIGANAIDEAFARHKGTAEASRQEAKADKERIEASIEYLYASAHEKAVDSLDKKSEALADRKIEASLKSMVWRQWFMAALLIVVCCGATHIVTQRWDRAALEQSESELHRVATMYGQDRLEAWLKIMRPNDPVLTWAPCYAGNIARATNGREVCQVPMYMYARPPAPPQH